MFLANIALVGQVYNLSSRPPNALLLWCAGIAALPWLLRSVAQHALFLISLILWLGMELTYEGGWLFAGRFESPASIACFMLLGLAIWGGGLCLRATTYAVFSPLTEQLGFIIFFFFGYILTFVDNNWHSTSPGLVAGPLLGGLAIIAAGAGMRHLSALDQQWKWVQMGLMTGWGVIGLATALSYQLLPDYWNRGFWDFHYTPFNLLVALSLFVTCMLQIHIGLLERAPFFINASIIGIGLIVITLFLRLVVDMQRTGSMFIVGGVFMIGLSAYLERKRRKILNSLQKV
jgi:uncharacterized membrane protein